MKKTKLIGLTTLLLSLGISGCFGTAGSDTNKGGKDDDGTTDVAEGTYMGVEKGHYKVDSKGNRLGEIEDHVLVDSTGDDKHKPVAATCALPGKGYKKCTVCGRFVEYSIDKLEHDYQPSSDPTKAATCTKPGYVECKMCGDLKETGKPLGHKFGAGEALTIEGATDAAVKKSSCTACSEISYEIDVKTGNFQLASGSSWKSGNNPESGAVKLNSDGQSFSFTFNLPKGFTGKMYQRAYMDNYSSNSSKKAFYETDSTANIEVLVNSNKVDLSSQNTVTFEQLFNGEVDGSNTVFKDILLGDVTLGTANTISYKRVKTLNMTVSTFVFVGSENA